jgi:fatty acid synthase subunit alpha
MMLTNVTRLMGAVKSKKQSRGYDTRPSMVILPLSPNHGVFGGDGLYAESKIALEVLFNKWHSESWYVAHAVVRAVLRNAVRAAVGLSGLARLSNALLRTNPGPSTSR